MSEGFMLGVDRKEQQRRDNCRRAEAFLLWKFGKNYDHVRDSLRGSGMDWPSLFVEFVEKVEEELLARLETIEKLHWDTENLKACAFPAPTSRASATFGEPFKTPVMGYVAPRPSMRRHWKDDPSAYSAEELEKLSKEEENGK